MGDISQSCGYVHKVGDSVSSKANNVNHVSNIPENSSVESHGLAESVHKNYAQCLDNGKTETIL